MYSKSPFLPLLVTLFALVFSFSSYGQNERFAEKFQEANRLDEETELGQSYIIWTALALENPGNANVSYKTGRAYLNSYNLKSAALPYLEKAVEGELDPKYDPFSPFEKDVPVEVFYYYAKALHLDYQLEKSQEYYEKFMMAAAGKHFLQVRANLGNNQVDNAEVLTKLPVDFEIENLGPVVNTIYPDMTPMVSVDENALFFTSARLRADSSNYAVTDKTTGYYFEDIYVSYKDRDGKWQRPELLSINNNDHMAAINVSVDGQILYIYKADVGNGDLYQSKLVGETWSEPEPMPEVINSPSWETHMCTSADGNTIYFVSDRKGGLGGRDIYRIRKLPNDKWSDAQNVGSVLNTEYDEDGVFLSPDEKVLYFSSEGHTSIGGFDVFYSRLGDDGEWGEPRNLGFPINTTDDDLFFVTSADGKRAYFSSERKDGMGKQDLYMIQLPDPTEVKLAVLKGTIIPAPGETLPNDLVVVVTNNETGEVNQFTPRKRDGTFVAILPPCFDYHVDYIVRGMEAATDTFSIGCDEAYQEIYKELLLNPIIADEGNPVMVASTSGDNVPSHFTRYFGYNENNVSAEEEMFERFMLSVKALEAREGKVTITILGSASKVPTSSYSSNQDLADKRAMNGKARVLKYAEQYKIDTSKLEFSVQGKIQGPEYTGDASAGKDKYKKFQYIEMLAK